MRLGRPSCRTAIALFLAATPALAQSPSDLDRTWSFLTALGPRSVSEVDQ